MRKYMWVWSLLGTAVLLTIIAAVAMRHAAATSKRLSAEAEAVGFQATPVSWEERDREGDTDTKHGHTLTFAYTVNGKVYSQTLERVTWYDTTRAYKVCYNPSDPKDSDLYTSDHRCGS